LKLWLTRDPEPPLPEAGFTVPLTEALALIDGACAAALAAAGSVPPGDRNGVKACGPSFWKAELTLV
jgi:hypothetical protein